MNKSESKYFNTATKMNRALMILLEKKSFEYITVTEICKVAGVNRSTFYLHYENTCDLLDETVRHMIDDFLAYFSVDFQNVTMQFSECELQDLNFITDAYLHPYLSYFRDHRRILSTAIRHADTLGFEDVYKRLFQHVFNPVLDRFHYPSEHRPYVMRFYLNGIHAIIAEWIGEDCRRPMDEVCSIIRVCIFGLQQ